MPATKISDLAVKTGEYMDRASGQMKGRYQNVGALMQGDDGSHFIMLAKWFNPVGVADLNGKGGESLLISCFAPKERDQGGQAPAARQAAPAQRQAQAPAPIPMDDDSDIPF